jgi:hypothetical protein
MGLPRLAGCEKYVSGKYLPVGGGWSHFGKRVCGLKRFSARGSLWSVHRITKRAFVEATTEKRAYFAQK